MGNLGWYQTMTTAAKKVGGPKRLVAIALLTGYAVFRPLEAGGKKVWAVSKPALMKRGAPCATKGQLFEVTADGSDSGAGLTFQAGDSFRVLECDGDSILIEVLGNPANPFFVSREFLMTLSAFPAGDSAAGG